MRGSGDIDGEDDGDLDMSREAKREQETRVRVIRVRWLVEHDPRAGQGGGTFNDVKREGKKERGRWRVCPENA